MPEGPEIRRAADAIERALGGQVIERVRFANGRLESWESRLSGLRLRAVDTVGKHMLCRFSDGTRIHSHNQLYGRWWVVRRGRQPDTRRSLRLALHGVRHSALLYSASDIDVIPEGCLGTHPRLANLGPDPLHRFVDAEAILERFRASRFDKRGLGGLLLDQGFLAGLGNYLRSEILFSARIGPRLRPADLDDVALRRLSVDILRITRRSYRTGGVTNSPSRAQRLRDLGWPREEYRFAVFGRGGQPCHDCGARIQRAVVAGRRLYHCPQCQAGGGV